MWAVQRTSLVPWPRPASHCLKLEKAEEGCKWQEAGWGLGRDWHNMGLGDSPKWQLSSICNFWHSYSLASSPGHSQILSRSRGEKSGEGLRSLLHHGPEMVDMVILDISPLLVRNVDLVCTNRVHHFRPVTYQWFQAFSRCEIKWVMSKFAIKGLVVPLISLWSFFVL